MRKQTNSSFRRWIPRPLRKYYRAHVFRKSMARLSNIADLSCIPPHLYDDLRYGWGNEGWSASSSFLQASLEHAIRSEGNILECGSGLSTILLALAAQRRGKTLVTLEHNAIWADRISKTLDRYQLHCAQLMLVPLRNYGGFDWYDMPSNLAPNSFDLVICDGPPGATLGGRVGMLPVAHSLLSPRVKILLDDIERLDERAAAERWISEFDMTLDIKRSEKPFGILTRKLSQLSS